MTYTLALAPRRVASVLTATAIFLCILSMGMKIVEWLADTQSTYWIYHITELVNVNRESSIPAYFSALLLLFSAALLGIVTWIKMRERGRYRLHWGLLALIFVWLSTDEAVSIHEILTVYIQENLNVTGFLYFGWVVVGIPVVIIWGLIFLRFVLHLPPATRRGVILAGALYVGGALGVESISANIWYENDGSNLAYSAVGTIEELMEMLGVIVFIHTLLSYIQQHTQQIVLTFGPAAAPDKPEPPPGSAEIS
jgi:hypothetical protein